MRDDVDPDRGRAGVTVAHHQRDGMETLIVALAPNRRVISRAASPKTE